jgi:hypothetical protein
VDLQSGKVLPADASKAREYFSGMMVLGFTFTAPVLKSKVKTVNSAFFLEIYEKSVSYTRLSLGGTVDTMSHLGYLVLKRLSYL